MIIGAYSLHLYCNYAHPESFVTISNRNSDKFHVHGEFPHLYTAETYSQCTAMARKDGWIINRAQDRAICPKCSGKNKGAHK